jgi:periplasmic protein TonB
MSCDQKKLPSYIPQNSYMKYFFLIAFSLLSTGAFSQVDSVDRIFTEVEVEASYSGDWRQFLKENLDPGVPVKEGARAGKYTVIVQFIVDRDGNISSITPLTAHGYGMEDEVVRVIRKSKKWKPAIQNGRTVKAYRKQPITFFVSEK